MLVDTHTHIYEPEFDDDREAVVARAAEAGVGLMLLPAIDGESYERMFDLCRSHPEAVRPMMGLHPTSVNDNPSWRDDLARVRSLLDSPPPGVGPFCAVGEIGLDFYWSRDFVEEQTEAFATQVGWAIERDLPIAVHTRDAWERMTEVMSRFAGSGVRGVFHAFSSDMECYRALRGCGAFVFGVGGTVTFRKSAVAEVVSQIPLEDIVIETDAPYLTPVPHRGSRNEPSYVRFVCAKIAELKGVDYDTVAAATTANAIRIFGVQQQ